MLPCAEPELFQAGKLVYRGCAEPAIIIRPWDPCFLMGRTFTSRGRNTGWNTSSSLVLVHGDWKPILEIIRTQPQKERHLKNKSQRLYAHTMSLECLTGAISWLHNHDNKWCPGMVIWRWVRRRDVDMEMITCRVSGGFPHWIHIQRWGTRTLKHSESIYSFQRYLFTTFTSESGWFWRSVQHF